MLDQAVAEAAAALRSARFVVVTTGAGISAESGIPTFRGGGGLWEGRRVEEVASPEGFADDPVAVWRFYDQRRVNIAKARPNPGHLVLAQWQDRFERFTLVTQNVDGLHEAAGSRNVVELHGNIWIVRCVRCGAEREDRTVPIAPLPPRCVRCGALERPGVVWFGETLPQRAMIAAWDAADTCDALVVVGTSAQVYPAAGLVEVAARGHARVIEINPEASRLAHLAHVALRGPAGELLPVLNATLGEA